MSTLSAIADSVCARSLDRLPARMTEPDSAATGKLIRPETVRRYAFEAGFSEVAELPIDGASFRIYLLRP